MVGEHLPIKRRKSPRNWLIFDAPCCHHRGHNKDTRSRGNLLFSPDGSIVYNCYNCGFKVLYKPGTGLTKKFEDLMHWFGIDQSKIQAIKLNLLQDKVDGVEGEITFSDLLFTNEFPEVELPLGATRIENLIGEIEDTNFLSVIDYLNSRGSVVANNWDYYWTPNEKTKYAMNKRFIIPFLHHNKIVGWTARYAGATPPGITRYYNSSIPENYLFNSDQITSRYDRKYVILVEGPLDAIAVDGVGALGSTVTTKQVAWLNSSGKEIIVVPDRELKNQDLIDTALTQNWSVSFPEWEDGIKDCAKATSRYGRLYTLKSIIESKTTNSLKINIKRKMFKE
jgi:hypothetical protein